MNHEDRPHRLVGRKQETSDVQTLSFAPVEGEQMEFRAGQYVYVDLIENPNKLASRPYSISSAPGDAELTLSVKRLGAFSGTLQDLPIGSEVLLRGPLGHFTPSPKMKKLVLVAGGIGIAPFRSMIRDLVQTGGEREILLFASNRTSENVVFFDELQKVAQDYPLVQVVFLLTQQIESVPGIAEYRRFDAPMLRAYCPDLSQREFFVCGSVPFVTETSKVIEGAGVSEEHIHAELFY